jgi:trans-AT polyketide synthase/acyltransferase/oxidoreductase domain-containing protein
MLACLFPGQGSQFKGMVRELFDAYPDIEREASEVLGYSIRRLCVEDPDNQLGHTQFTQPALFVANALTWLHKSGGRRPDFAAGHSLGEYNALWAAGVMSFSDGVRLVQKRGELMSKVSGGGMAAVIGLTPHRVRRVIEESELQSLDVANFNSYDQTVVSGPGEELERAISVFKSSGASHVIALSVSAPFHSRYMTDVAGAFAATLDAVTLKPPQFPVIANCTALPYTHENLRENMLRQIASPVRWIESIEYLLRHEVTQFEEIGPGTVLQKLLSQIRSRTVFA